MWDGPAWPLLAFSPAQCSLATAKKGQKEPETQPHWETSNDGEDDGDRIQ